MAKVNLAKMLNSPDKEVNKTSGANGVLSRLFRQILGDLNINPHRFEIHMLQFLGDPKNGYPNNRRDQTSARGNLMKEFARPQMTWKVFCKALRFLSFTSIELTIIGKRHGRETVHKTSINFTHSTEDTFLASIEQAEEREQTVPVSYLDVKKAPEMTIVTPPIRKYDGELPKVIRTEPICALLRPSQEKKLDQPNEQK